MKNFAFSMLKKGIVGAAMAFSVSAFGQKTFPPSTTQTPPQNNPLQIMGAPDWDIALVKVEAMPPDFCVPELRLKFTIKNTGKQALDMETVQKMTIRVSPTNGQTACAPVEIDMSDFKKEFRKDDLLTFNGTMNVDQKLGKYLKSKYPLNFELETYPKDKVASNNKLVPPTDIFTYYKGIGDKSPIIELAHCTFSAVQCPELVGQHKFTAAFDLTNGPYSICVENVRLKFELDSSPGVYFSDFGFGSSTLYRGTHDSYSHFVLQPSCLDYLPHGTLILEIISPGESVFKPVCSCPIE